MYCEYFRLKTKNNSNLNGKPYINMFVYLSLCYQREQIAIFLTENILLQVFHNYFSAVRSVQLFSFGSICP